MIVQYLGLYDRSKDLLEILDFDKAMEFNQSQRELSHILIANEISEVEILETCADRLVGGGKIVIYQRSLAVNFLDLICLGVGKSSGVVVWEWEVSECECCG